MVWTTPTLVEICIGLEINGYLPAEFWYRPATGRDPRQTSGQSAWEGRNATPPERCRGENLLL